jgi:octaprenyl-diphosphate synthase
MHASKSASPDTATPPVAGDGAASVPPALASARVRMSDVMAPVADDLQAFERYFRDALRTDVRLLNLVLRYLLRQKGKRIRPTLVLLSARTVGQTSESTFRAAALVELLHTATLIHDDVVDEAETRRGAFSINALWKNKVGVLLGDYFLSRGLLLALDNRDYDALHALSDAVRRMSEGELMQIEKARRLDITEDDYFRIISDKTASLISTCTAAGALSAGATEEQVGRMKAFGEALGLAFQIRDDLFDYGSEDVGKPLGIDVQERKMTLPLIYALREAPSADVRRIRRIVRTKRKSRAQVDEVIAFVREAGGLDYARSRMHAYADEARGLLLSFEPGPARDALDDLVTYTVQRKL